MSLGCDIGHRDIIERRGPHETGERLEQAATKLDVGWRKPRPTICLLDDVHPGSPVRLDSRAAIVACGGLGPKARAYSHATEMRGHRNLNRQVLSWRAVQLYTNCTRDVWGWRTQWP